MNVLLAALSLFSGDPQTASPTPDPAAVRPVGLQSSIQPRLVPPSAQSSAELSAVTVTLECTARASGRIDNCRVLEETHPDLGFGQAAIEMMRDVTTDPRPADIQFARTFAFSPE